MLQLESEGNLEAIFLLFSGEPRSFSQGVQLIGLG